jgi:hypothetical protein
MTIGIIDSTKSVQGSAFYAEFTNPYGNVFQIFITPDGINEVGELVTATAFTRTLSEAKPKRQWRATKLGRQIVNDEGVATPESREARLTALEYTIRRLSTQYTLVVKPLFVEVSKKDLLDVGLGKTPIKVTYRIGQTRSAQGFPDMFTK